MMNANSVMGVHCEIDLVNPPTCFLRIKNGLTNKSTLLPNAINKNNLPIPPTNYTGKPIPLAAPSSACEVNIIKHCLDGGHSLIITVAEYIILH